MDILFLGTSSGAPTKTRNVTGIALLEETGSAWYLVDCGEGTQHQLLRTSLSTNDLQAIFITHVHGDHCYGLPGLVATAGMQGRKKPLTIVAPAGIEEWMKSTLQLTQLFLPYELQFVAAESLAGWKINDLLVDAIELSHRVPSFGYRFTEAKLESVLDTERLTREGVPQGPLWGQLKKGMDVVHEGSTLHSGDYLRFPHPPRRVIVAGDNDRPALLNDACQQAQVLVHEATYTKDVGEKVGASVGHSTAASVASFAQSIGLPNLVLTHFSARYQSDPNQPPSIEDVRAEAAANYQGQLYLAEDFARYRLSRAGQLSRVA